MLQGVITLFLVSAIVAMIDGFKLRSCIIDQVIDQGPIGENHR